MPYRAKAAEILQMWRSLQRLFNEAPEADIRIEFHLETVRLRREYQAAFDAAQAAKLPEPPAFPDERPAEAARLPV